MRASFTASYFQTMIFFSLHKRDSEDTKRKKNIYETLLS